MIDVQIGDIAGLTTPDGPMKGRVVAVVPLHGDNLVSIDVGEAMFYRCAMDTSLVLWIPAFITQIATQIGRNSAVLVTRGDEDTVYRIDLPWQAHGGEFPRHYLILRHRHHQFWIAFLHSFQCYEQSEPFLDDGKETPAHTTPKSAYLDLLAHLKRSAEALTYTHSRLSSVVGPIMVFDRFLPDFNRIKFVSRVLMAHSDLGLKAAKTQMERLLEHGSIKVQLKLDADVEACLQLARDHGVFGHLEASFNGVTTEAKPKPESDAIPDRDIAQADKEFTEVLLGSPDLTFPDLTKLPPKHPFKVTLAEKYVPSLQEEGADLAKVSPALPTETSDA